MSLFADVLLYHIIGLVEDCILLQGDLDAFELWEEAWQMRYNALKCQYISYCNKRAPIQYEQYQLVHPW